MKLYILSGGQSRRMGKPKTEILLAGKKLFHHMVALARPIFLDNIFAVSRKDQPISYKEVNVIYDEIDGCGPLGGIYTALRHSQEEKIFILSCDMPLLQLGALEKLIYSSKEFDVTVPVVQDYFEPLCGVYSKNCLPAILEQINKKEYRIYDFYESVKLNPVEFEFPDQFCNVNSPEDLLKAENILFTKVLHEPTPIICFVGKSNIGKTTFLEKLLSLLANDGIRTGIVKHDVHGFEMDKPGKDTYRLKHAGASGVIISSPQKFAIIKDVKFEKSLAELAGDYFSEYDLLLTEGYKQGPFPKIEVYRDGIHKAPLCTGDDNLIAAVSDNPGIFSVPVFDINKPEECRNFILDYIKSFGR